VNVIVGDLAYRAHARSLKRHAIHFAGLNAGAIAIELSQTLYPDGGIQIEAPFVVPLPDATMV
jgi:hypothetical protein